MSVDNKTKLWKIKFCNITIEFSKYLNFNILRTLNAKDKVLFLKLITLEWAIQDPRFFLPDFAE